MSPHRTGGKERGGMFRFDRILKGIGRINCSSGTANLREFRKRDAILTKLFENSQLEVLRAFQRGDLTIKQLVEADRAQLLGSAVLLSDLTLRRNLWEAFEETLPRLARSEQTRRRYRISFLALKRRNLSELGAKATIRDLLRVDWKGLSASWGMSPADWNNLAIALSSFLSTALGDKYHPFRRQVMAKVQKRPVAARRPEIVPLFWEIIRRTPEHARPCYVVLGVTGMRTGEYLACTKERLRPSIFAVDVPKGKTGAHRYFVDPEYWPWIEAGVPSPLRYQWMREYFKRAVRELGHPTLRLHDLRHLFAQVAKRSGMRTADTQAALGQKTPGITRDYEMEEVQSAVARAVGRALAQNQSEGLERAASD